MRRPDNNVLILPVEDDMPTSTGPVTEEGGAVVRIPAFLAAFDAALALSAPTT